MIALAAALALVLAPLIVIVTHSPAAYVAAASMTADLAADVAEEVAAHGHTHDHAGHDHDGSFGAHNPADHDHQLYALIDPATSAPKPLPDKKQCAPGNVFRHLTPEEPRHPPRLV